MACLNVLESSDSETIRPTHSTSQRETLVFNVLTIAGQESALDSSLVDQNTRDPWIVDLFESRRVSIVHERKGGTQGERTSSARKTVR
jgi:hypothetical protein